MTDFVIYLGDVITANNIMIKNASLYWDQAISPTRAKGIPWASVFGNHDDASFEWPMEWFSATGIPHLHCPAPSASDAGELQVSLFSATHLAKMRTTFRFDHLKLELRTLMRKLLLKKGKK